MPVTTMRRKQVVLSLAAGGGEGRMHPLRKLGPKKGVVLDIHPEHRYARSAAELAGRPDQPVGCAIIVGLAVDPAATSGRKGDDRLHRWRIRARPRNRPPPPGRSADHE